MNSQKGWKIETFGNIVSKEKHSFKRGPFGGSLTKSMFVPEGYKVYEQKHAINNNFDLGTYYIDEKKFKEMSAFKVRPGDFIISCSGTIGKMAEIPADAKEGIINQALLKITIDERKVLKKYFCYLWESNLIQKYLSKVSRGVAIKNVPSVKDLKKINIPIPNSLKEQQQIVDEIEKQFTRLDASVKDLKNVKDKLEIYEKSVLNKTYKGNSNWIKSTIGDSIYKIEQVVPQNSEFKELTYIDIASIDNTKQRIVNKNKILSSDAPSRARQLTLVGDIVFSTVRTYLKNIAIIPDIKGTIISSTGFAVLRPKKSVNRDFLFFYLLSDKLLRDINKMQVGTSYPAIRKNDLLDYELRYPESLLEQERIISDVESHFSIIDKLEQTIDSALRQTEQLRKSILKSAFEGKLVKSVC